MLVDVRRTICGLIVFGSPLVFTLTLILWFRGWHGGDFWKWEVGNSSANIDANIDSAGDWIAFYLHVYRPPLLVKSLYLRLPYPLVGVVSALAPLILLMCRRRVLRRLHNPTDCASCS